jgi:hypothetical protein
VSGKRGLFLELYLDGQASSACCPGLRRGGRLAVPPRASHGISTRCGEGLPPRTMPGPVPATCLTSRRASVRPGVGRDSGTGDAFRALTRDPRRAPRRGDRGPVSMAGSAMRARRRCPRTLVAVARRRPAPSRPRAAHSAPRAGALQRFRSCRHALAACPGARRAPMASRRARRPGRAPRHPRVCDALDLEASVLAAAVRARTG